MASKRCVACGKAFPSCPQVPTQAYCSAEACQRERRKLWQRDKRHLDADYQDNQKRANKKWLEGQPDYWQRYRAQHPEYAERNRARQRVRNASRHVVVAKMDESNPSMFIRSGIYELTRYGTEKIAKMDVWLVRLTLLSKRSASER